MVTFGLIILSRDCDYDFSLLVWKQKNYVLHMLWSKVTEQHLVGLVFFSPDRALFIEAGLNTCFLSDADVF